MAGGGGGGGSSPSSLDQAIIAQGATPTTSQAFQTTITLANTFSWVWQDPAGNRIIRMRGDAVNFAFEVTAGTTATGAGQGISLIAGNATTAGQRGGPVDVVGGDGLGIGAGENVTLQAGHSDPAAGTGTGGSFSGSGGNGGGAGGPGGGAALTAGSALFGNNNGGLAQVSAGQRSGTGLQGRIEFAGPIVYQSNVNATLALGDNNDFAPAGGSYANRMRLTPNAGGSEVTGIAEPQGGRVLALMNISATVPITIANEDAGSVAANRVLTPSAAVFTIPPQAFVMLMYDPAPTSRWRVHA